MVRAFFFALALFLCVPPTAHADDVAEAAQLFDRGNDHFQQGMRARGARRTRELEAALEDYFASLRLVRSRNVLYNTALVLEQLERWDDAFNYWGEYLAVTGLSAEETADGTTHRDAVRPRVAVVRIESTPAGAEVWIDRRDLAARGHTPLELALPAGEHTVYLVQSGWEDGEGRVTATLGASETVSLALTPRPVMVQVLAPDARLLLDGEAIRAGASMPVVPGPHLLTLELEGRPPVERRFEVVPGGAPMVIDLTTAAASVREERAEASLSVRASRASRVLVDGVVVGSGITLELPVTPGEHEIAVESDAPTWRGRATFEEGSQATLHLDSHGTSDALIAGRVLLGIVGGIALVSAAVLSVAAWDARQRYDRMEAPTQADFQGVMDLNLAADVSWGASLGVGTFAIVLLIADDAGTSGELVVEEE